MLQSLRGHIHPLLQLAEFRHGICNVVPQSFMLCIEYLITEREQVSVALLPSDDMTHQTFLNNPSES